MFWLMMCFLCVTASRVRREYTKDGLATTEEPYTTRSSYDYYTNNKLPPCQDCSKYCSKAVLKSNTAMCRKHNFQEYWENPFACAVLWIVTKIATGCGERNEESRVVGGTDSDVNAFPWLARLVYNKSFGCGASLINDRFVLSAAHCVKGFMWFLFKVTFGEHNRCNQRQPPESRYVVKLYAHDFSLKHLSNDVALLLVNTPIIYTHAIKPVCLPKYPEKTYVGATATVAGWGATSETGNWSCSVMEAELPVLSNEECKNTKYNATKIKDVMLCAGFPSTAHKDACTGDSGGPLIAENKDHAYEIIGVVSWGYGCARIGYPGVYARVTKYLDWIRDNTKGACYCKY